MWINHAAVLAPVAQAEAANRLFNVIQSDSGDNLSRFLSATGAEPASHVAGSFVVQQSWIALCVDGLADKIEADEVAPAGGWPLMDGETVLLSKADAKTAANALIISVKAMDVVEPDNLAAFAARNFAAVYDAENLALIPGPED